MPESRPGYLKDIHAFRGIAIANIVAVHVFDAYLLNSHRLVPLNGAGATLAIANEVLFHDSTIYFALISGLLFSRILVGRGWLIFYRSKLLNVVLPYAFMTFVFSLIWYDEGDCAVPSLCVGDSLIVTFEGLPLFIERYFLNVLQGTAIIPYWYIPILTCLFLATPALYMLARKAPLSILLVAILPFFLSRTGIRVTAESVIYFAGAYSVGMCLGMNYKENLSKLKKHATMIAIIALGTSMILWVTYTRDVKYIGPVSIRETLFYIQKLCLSGLILVLLNRWEERLPKFLGVLATYAFSVYFIHLFVLLPFINISLTLRPPPTSLVETVLSGFVILVTVLTVSTVVSMGVKALIGKRSRLLIGA